VDISLLVRQRLKDFGLGQKDLASAAQVTESYISQLLSRKKAPPDPSRTDLYEKIGQFLKLHPGELSTLAKHQRQQELKKRVAEPLMPLFKDSRELVLRKCDNGRRNEIQAIFERQPFGELERLVTQMLLDVVQGAARDELRNEAWLRALAELSGRSYEQMRVQILEFLDTDVFSISAEDCASFLDPVIESWDIDLRTFDLEITLSKRLTPHVIKRFQFAEKHSVEADVAEPAFEEFLRDAVLSGNITEAEIDFLKQLKFNGRRPSPLYYYRELQSLRDPLHFPAANQPGAHDSENDVMKSASRAGSRNGNKRAPPD
jgi:transcriptional regulator with XRE-family HTH domain